MNFKYKMVCLGAWWSSGQCDCRLLIAYYYDQSSNPAEAYGFFCNIVFENNEKKQKEVEVGPLF